MNMRSVMSITLIWMGMVAPVLGFQTEDGQVRMFRVADSVAMRREWLSKGDLVSIEVDLDDQIVNIVKVDRRSEPNRQVSRRK